MLQNTMVTLINKAQFTLEKECVMKTNEYIQKYGEKALQFLNKKQQKQTITSDINIASDSEQPNEPIPKIDKKSLLKYQKSNSNKSLSRNSKSKSKITLPICQNQYTFQKPINFSSLQDKEKGKKKLIISGLSTPKNNRSARMASAFEQKVQSSSTKKKATDIRISQKLNDVLLKPKSTKSVVKQLLECLDMISQHEYKINKWVSQFKQILYHIADQASTYRRKYKQELMKNKKMSKQIEQLHTSIKCNIDKKRKPLQVVIMQQNNKLRQRVQKLQQKIQTYQRKQLILIQTLQKLKISPSKTVLQLTTQQQQQQQQQTNSSSKKQSQYGTSKIKKQFYGNLEEDDEEQEQDQDENQQSDLGEKYKENQ